MQQGFQLIGRERPERFVGRNEAVPETELTVGEHQRRLVVVSSMEASDDAIIESVANLEAFVCQRGAWPDRLLAGPASGSRELADGAVASDGRATFVPAPAGSGRSKPAREGRAPGCLLTSRSLHERHGEPDRGRNQQRATGRIKGTILRGAGGREWPVRDRPGRSPWIPWPVFSRGPRLNELIWGTP